MDSRPITASNCSLSALYTPLPSEFTPAPFSALLRTPHPCVPCLSLPLHPFSCLHLISPLTATSSTTLRLLSYLRRGPTLRRSPPYPPTVSVPLFTAVRSRQSLWTQVDLPCTSAHAASCPPPPQSHPNCTSTSGTEQRRIYSAYILTEPDRILLRSAGNCYYK